MAAPPPPPPFRSPPPMNVGISTPPPPARKSPPDPHELGAPPPPARLSPQAPPPRKYPNSNDLDRSASVSPPPVSMPPMPSSPLPPAPLPVFPSQPQAPPPMPSGALPPLPSAPLPALPQVDIPDENSTSHDSDHSEPSTPTNMPAAPSSDASTQGILPPDDPIYQNRFNFISDLPPVPHWTSIPKHYVQGNPHPICPEIPGLSHSFHSSSSLSPNTSTSRVRSSSDSYIQAPTKNSHKEFDQPTRMTRGSVGANLQSKSTITFGGGGGGGGARPLGSAPHRSPPAVPRSMFPLTVNTIPSPSSATTSTSTSLPSPQSSPTNTNASSPAASAPAPASSPPAIPKKPALLPKPHINTGTLTLSPTGTPQIPAKPVMSPKPNLPAKPSAAAAAASPSASPSSAATSSVPVAPPMGNNTPPSGSPQIPPRRTLPPTPST